MDVISYLYAAVLFIGGLIGYFKAGSVMSLFSSTLISTFVVYGAYLSGQTPRNINVLVSVCTFMAVLMGYRFIKTSKFIPSGLIAILSALQVFRLLVGSIRPTARND